MSYIVPITTVIDTSKISWLTDSKTNNAEKAEESYECEEEDDSFDAIWEMEDAGAI